MTEKPTDHELDDIAGMGISTAAMPHIQLLATARQLAVELKDSRAEVLRLKREIEDLASDLRETR